MIQFENVTKSYGVHTLFEKISFRINSKEKIGLVGRNGHGKTTLFRMIANETQPDSGSIIIPKNYRIGYVKQEINFNKNMVLEECLTGLLPKESDQTWKAEKILEGLGFTKDDFYRNPFEFSGGFQVRINLAKVLVSEPDLLLLDEPTNFLDITSIRWVERFLNDWPHELLLITHDRGFMDKTVTHILGLHRKKARKLPGQTEKYYSQIVLEEEVYEKTRINDEKRRKEIELFVTRFRAKARLANMVQSRIKTLAKKEKQEKLEKLKTLDFSFRTKQFPGKYILTAKDVSFSYDEEKPLIEKFNISVKRGDRVCIIGKNGKGKTTLIKLLAGALPLKKGNISFHPEASVGFFEQNHVDGLMDQRSVLEEILYSDSNVDMQTARDISGAMMFEGDLALKKIQVLSGGEKSRVILGKVMATPVNLLLLDEPTNHLDMESSDAMLAAIDNFDGAVIMVTHNEMFLHSLSQRLIVFQNDAIEVFEGSYQDFLDRIGWQEEKPFRRNSSSSSSMGCDSPAIQKKKMKRMRSEFINERSRVLGPLKEQIKKLEEQIETNEKKLGVLTAEMQAASYAKKSDKINILSRSIFFCQAEIDALFDKLEALTNDLEAHSLIFDDKLEQMEKQWRMQ